MRRASSGLLLIGVILVACAADRRDDGTDDEVCEPGETQPCTCTDGSAGAQSCNAEGTGWEECVCTGGDAALLLPSLEARHEPELIFLGMGVALEAP